MSFGRRLRISLGASGALAGLVGAVASAQLLGPEFQVSTSTLGSQESPHVSADGGGNFVVVWTGYAAQEGPDVFGRRFDASATPLGDEFQVNGLTTDSQLASSVAVGVAGEFVVGWSTYVDGAWNADAFAQRFDADGLPVGPELQVNSYTTGPQSEPALAMDAAGNFVAVWSDYLQANLFDVFGQRYDSAGSPLGGEFQVNTYTHLMQKAGDVEMHAAGGFVVTWGSIHSDDLYHVIARRFDSMGVPTGSEYQVDDGTSAPVQDPEGPRMALDAMGNGVVVWTKTEIDGSGFGVFARRLDAEGLPVENEFRVNTHTAGNQSSPDVATDDAGSFLVVWDSPHDGSGLGVFAQRFDAAGSRVGSELRVNRERAEVQGEPAVSALAEGEFVVVWQSWAQDGSHYGVFGQRVLFPFFYGGFEPGDFGEWSSVCNDGDVCP